MNRADELNRRVAHDPLRAILGHLNNAIPRLDAQIDQCRCGPRHTLGKLRPSRSSPAIALLFLQCWLVAKLLDTFGEHGEQRGLGVFWHRAGTCSCVRQNADSCDIRPHSGECSYGIENEDYTRSKIVAIP